MYEFRWLNHLPGGTLEGGIEFANRLYWNITWAGNDQAWCVWAGEVLILRADSKEVAEAFLYGLGLAYGVLPEDIFHTLEHEVKRQVAPEDLEAIAPSD
jgi:hypothetical protein